MTKSTLSLKQIQCIAEDHVGTRDDCDWDRRTAFLYETPGVEEVGYFARDLEDLDFEPDTIEYPILDWSSDRVEELASGNDEPTLAELDAWRRLTARRLAGQAENMFYIVPVMVHDQVEGYAVVEGGVLNDPDPDICVVTVTRTRAEAWAAAAENLILDRDFSDGER